MFRTLELAYTVPTLISPNKMRDLFLKVVLLQKTSYSKIYILMLPIREENENDDGTLLVYREST